MHMRYQRHPGEFIQTMGSVLDKGLYLGICTGHSHRPGGSLYR